MSLKRSPFARPVYAPAPRAPLTRAVRQGTYSTSGGVAAVPKDNPIQHEGYMAVVRKLKCIHCGLPDHSQFAHADMDKGMGIKSDCRQGYPACGPHLLADGSIDPGCHWRIGTKRIYDKARRHEIEIDFGRRTRATVLALGKWPRNLPIWKVEE